MIISMEEKKRRKKIKRDWFNISLPLLPDQAAKLDTIADSLQITRNQALRDAVDDYIQKHQALFDDE